MAKVMIQQKLGLDSFRKLTDQIKAEGVHVVTSDGRDMSTRAVLQPDVICKVQSAFNLGKKIDVLFDRQDVLTKGYEFHFTKFNDVFYLVRK
jgi:hypothetical protein